MLSPINTNKHFVHLVRTVVATGTMLNVVVVNSVVAPAAAATNQVTEGSVIKAIFFELWMHSNVTTGGTTTAFNVTVEKRPANAAAMTNANASNLQSYANKKNVLYTTQGVLGPDAAQAVPLLRQWIAIPKGKQRMGFEDDVVLNINSITGALSVCGITIYKEYR